MWYIVEWKAFSNIKHETLDERENKYLESKYGERSAKLTCQ